MTYGITTEGFVAKPADVIKSEYDQDMKDLYGSSIGSEPDGSIPAATSIGQDVALRVDRDATFWQLMAAIYSSFDEGQAVTPQLQIVCALTGTKQEDEAASSTVETLMGTAGTVIPSGRVIAVDPTGARFVTQAPVTLALVSAVWASSTAFDTDALIINDGKVWQAIEGGTSDGVGTGPAGAVAAVVTDGTVTWRAMCLSTVAVALVDVLAESTGPIGASGGTLTSIATPVLGWSSAYNVHAASLGRTIESEPALRARRRAELQGSGGGPADAIRAKLLRTIPEIEDCRVFVNKTDYVDADGVPAHGVEVLIQAPSTSPTTDAELALAVWQAVDAGTAFGGTTTETITDASGNPQEVKFTRPSEVPIYSALTAFYDPTLWPGGDAAVEAAMKSAVCTWGASLGIGVDVRAAAIGAAAIYGPQQVTAAGDPVVPAADGSPPAQGIYGVANGAGTDGTQPYIGTAPSPVSSNKVAITLRQRATFDPANVSVTASAVTTP